MGMPRLYYGGDFDTTFKQMRKEAIELLGLKTEVELLSCGDYQELAPTSKSYLHSMEGIQNLVKESNLPPLNKDIRIVAILSADRMLPAHANALLKTLEDAPDAFLLLLVTTKYEDILKTILSRVQKTHVTGSGELPDYTQKIEEMMNLLVDNKFDSFFKSLDELDKSITENIETAEKKLRHFLETFLDVYAKKAGNTSLTASTILRLNKLIAVSLKGYLGNIRIKHVLENLFIETEQLHYSS